MMVKWVNEVKRLHSLLPQHFRFSFTFPRTQLICRVHGTAVGCSWGLWYNYFRTILLRFVLKYMSAEFEFSCTEFTQLLTRIGLDSRSILSAFEVRCRGKLLPVVTERVACYLNEYDVGLASHRSWERLTVGHYCAATISFYLFIKQFHKKNMTADNTRTGPTRLAKHSQWPQ